MFNKNFYKIANKVIRIIFAVGFFVGIFMLFAVAGQLEQDMITPIQALIENIIFFVFIVICGTGYNYFKGGK